MLRQVRDVYSDLSLLFGPLLALALLPVALIIAAWEAWRD